MTAKQDTLSDLPDHYVRDRALWRRRVQRRRDLTVGARFYAGYLAFHRAGKGHVAWVREHAARALGVSVRTIQRWTRELLDAGLLRRVVVAMPGRRQVFALVKMEDTTVSPSGERPPVPTRGGTAHAYVYAKTTASNWTTTSRPAHPDAPVPPDRGTPAREGT